MGFGILQIKEIYMSWISENICALLTDLLSAVIDSYGTFISNIFFSFVKVASENTYYKNGQMLFVLLGFSLIGLMTAKIVSSGYMLETAYDSEEDPFNLLIRIAQATAIISSAGWMFSFGLQMSKDLCTDLIGSTAVTGFDGQTRALLDVIKTNSGPQPNLAFIGMILIILISFIIFTIMSGLRAGELLVMNLCLPIFAVDLLTNSREIWNNYFMGYIFAFFSYAIQSLFFMISMKNYLSATYTDQKYMLSALIWIIVAIKAPQFIEKFLYKTGVSNAASSGLRIVTQSLIMRSAMAR